MTPNDDIWLFRCYIAGVQLSRVCLKGGIGEPKRPDSNPADAYVTAKNPILIIRKKEK